MFLRFTVIRRILLVTVLLCLYVAGWSQIKISQKKQSLDDGLLLLPDSTLFLPGEQNVSLFGPYQFEVTLINPLDSPQNGYLTFENEYFRAYDWKISGPNGVKQYSPLSNEFRISIPPKAKVTVQFFVSEVDRMTGNRLSLIYLSEKAWESQNEQRDIAQAFFLGVFLFLALFNLIFYFVSKWAVYAKYAAYIFSASCYLLYYFGYLQHYFPVLERLSVNAVSVCYSLIFILYFWFLKDLGDYQKTVPKADFFLKVGIVYKLVHIIIELPMLLMGWSLITHPIYKYTFLLFEIGLMCLIIFHIVKARNFRGRIVIAGSLLLILAAIAAQLDTGLDRAMVLESGILAELMLFSVGMGYISRRYYEEKNEVQLLYVDQLEENERILKDIEKQLEQKVNLRTRELQLEKQKVEAKNHENQVLLNEIHHRVKNNLQMISSMLAMQQRRIHGSAEGERIKETANRINVIGLLHEHLYKQADHSLIELKSYLKGLTSLVRGSMPGKDCKLTMDVTGTSVSGSLAICIGLILNELLVNSFKHAKPENLLEIQVRVIDEEERLFITVEDNGVHEKKSVQKGFGLTLIDTLLQGNGTLACTTSEKGFLTHVEYQKQEYHLV